MRHLVSLVSALVYVFLVAPIFVVVVASFNAGSFLTFPPHGLSLRWYVAFLHNRVFLVAFATSIKVALVATGVSGVIGTMAALYAARARPALADGVRILMTAPLLLPEVLTAIGLLFFFYGIGLGLHHSVALIVGHVLLTLPFVYINVSTSLRGFDWSWEMAARSLGASPAAAFRRVVMPMIKPGVISGCLFGFIVSFDAFSTSFLLKDIGTATLPLQLFDYLRLNFTPEAAAVSSFTILLSFVVIFVTERAFGLRVRRF